MRVDDRSDDRELLESPDGDYLAKEEVQPILDAYKAIIEKLLYYKDDVQDNTVYRIKETYLYKELQAIPEEDLGRYINKYPTDSASHFFISCRLSGDDPFEKDLLKCVGLLNDIAFDIEAYRNIGYNDGLASLTSTLLTIVGMDKEATQAIDATYSD